LFGVSAIGQVRAGGNDLDPLEIEGPAPRILDDHERIHVSPVVSRRRRDHLRPVAAVPIPEPGADKSTS
jgi:hypothetical protein